MIRKKATNFMISDNGVMFYKHKKKQKVIYVSYIPIHLAGIEPRAVFRLVLSNTHSFIYAPFLFIGTAPVLHFEP